MSNVQAGICQDELTVRLDRFRHHEDDEVAMITLEAANEICRLNAENERMHERLKITVSQSVKAHTALTGLKLIVGEARAAGFVQGHQESNVEFVGRAFRELASKHSVG